MRGDDLYVTRKQLMGFDVNGTVDSIDRCRISSQEIVSAQIRFGSVWSGAESPTTIWTHVQKNLIYAGLTERALISTDHCLLRGWR